MKNRLMPAQSVRAQQMVGVIQCDGIIEGVPKMGRAQNYQQ